MTDWDKLVEHLEESKLSEEECVALKKEATLKRGLNITDLKQLQDMVDLCKVDPDSTIVT